MAGGYDIIIQQGATFTMDVQVQSINLTSGYTVRMKGRPSHASSTTTFSLTNGAGITLSHSGQGHSHIVPLIAAATTATYTAPMAGVYDIEYENTSTGVVTRILEGTFYVTPEVTRA